MLAPGPSVDLSWLSRQSLDESPKWKFGHWGTFGGRWLAPLSGPRGHASLDDAATNPVGGKFSGILGGHTGMKLLGYGSTHVVFCALPG